MRTEADTKLDILPALKGSPFSLILRNPLQCVVLTSHNANATPNIRLAMIQQRAAKALIKNEEGEILLLRTSHDGESYWDLPGGRIEEGETVPQTLTRECAEEIGATVSTIGRKLGSFSFSFQNDGNTYNVTADVHECSISNPDDIRANDAEDLSTLHEVEWVHPEDLHEYQLGAVSSVLK